MDYSKRGVVKKQHEIKSTTKRLSSKLRIISFRLALVCVVFIVIIGVTAVIGAAAGIIDSAPDISQVNIDPEGFTTHIYYNDGTLSQKLIAPEANRVLVTIDQIPDVLEHAFVALEDERFYEHYGIDIQGIFRAGFSVFKTKGLGFGGSTITQQLLKDKVFNGGNESNLVDKCVRKLQEQYLAIKLENECTKDQIMEAYLNNINLSNRSYGVQTAAQNYFGKNVWELTLSEATVLAPIALSPVRCNPINHPDTNAERRQKCLDNMLELGYCTKQQYDEALADNVYQRIKDFDEQKEQSSYYSYFTDALIEQILSDLVSKKGYTQDQAESLLFSGGLEIYSTQDSTIQGIMDKYFLDESNFPAVGDGSYYYLSKYDLTITKANDDVINYHLNDLLTYFQDFDDSNHLYYHDRKPYKGMNTLGYDKEDMLAKIEAFKEAMLEEGDSVNGEAISILLEPQCSMTIMDQHNGHVVALYGGRGEKTANRTINRASSTRRQVGSTFKVLASFLPALDTCGFTLASVMDDSAYTYPGSKDTVTNWNHTYKGLSTMRDGISHSMNIVACRFMEAVTPRVGFDYLKKLGFNLVESQTGADGRVYSDLNVSLALGGITNGVTNMELTAGYAAIANNGVYNAPVLYTKIMDHNGKVLLSNEPSSEQVFKTSTAWLLTSAMQDVVKIGTGTNVRFKNYDMPIAGKTGSAQAYDLWFVGFTPYYTSAIWTGFDYNFPQTEKKYHQFIWRNIMEEIHSTLKLEYKTFEKPDSITSAVVCTKCGNLAIDGVCNHALSGNCTRTEYFAKGTAPTKYCTCHIKVAIDKVSGHFATPYCPAENLEDRVYLIKDETSATADTPFIYPTDQRAEPCPLHSEGSVAPPVDDDLVPPGDELPGVEDEPDMNIPDEVPEQNQDTSPPVVIVTPEP